VSCTAGRSRHGVLSEQARAKARKQMAGGRVEEVMGAKHRFHSSRCACVPCTTLICQGMEAKKVMAHSQQRGSTPLALQKGLLSAGVWRIIDLANCLPGIWVPQACTPATLLPEGVCVRLRRAGIRRRAPLTGRVGKRIFVPHSEERQVRLAEASNITRRKGL
jgi:hypothetical protein